MQTLEDILLWMKAQGLPLRSLESVTMDEYNHDVLFPHEGQWHVYGVT